MLTDAKQEGVSQWFASADCIICFIMLLKSVFLAAHHGSEKWDCIQKEKGPSCIGICAESTCSLCLSWPCSCQKTYVIFEPALPRAIMCPYSLLPLVRTEKICHTLCFVATCCLVKPHEDVLVVADSILELRWKFSRTEECFCWQKSETGGQSEKTWYLEGRKNSCGFVGRTYN